MQIESLGAAEEPEVGATDRPFADAMAKAPVPIFVLAAPLMPNHMLAAALGRNPLAQDLPELNLELMPTVDVLLRELTGLRTPQVHGLLRALAHLLTGEQTAPSVETARRWLNRRSYMGTAQAAAEVLRLVAPRRLIAPVTAALFDRGSLRRLTDSHPTAVFVHLQAHPRNYGSLVMSDPNGKAALLLSGAVDETVSPALPDPQNLWLMVETAIADFFEGVPAENRFAVKFEDLLSDPGAALTDLAARLGLAADPQAVARMLTPEQSVFVGPGPMGAHVSGGISGFADWQARLPQPASPGDAEGATVAGLTGALAWRADGAGFCAEVQRRAGDLGYV